MVNYDPRTGTEQEVVKKLKNVPRVIYVSEVSGFYDKVAKIGSEILKKIERNNIPRHKIYRHNQINDDINSGRMENSAG